MIGTLALLLLLVVESTRFSGPFRRAVTFDPLTYHEGLGLLVLLAVPTLAWLAWRRRALVPATGRGMTILYVVLLAAYALAVVVASSGGRAAEAGTPWYALRVAMVPAEVVLFGFLAPAVLRRPEAELAIRVLVWVLAAFAILSLAWTAEMGRADFLGLPLSEPPDDRGGRLAASGFFVHRNMIGGILALVIPAGGWLAWTQGGRGERRVARVTGALVVLLAAWLVLCFSRSSELSVAVTAAVAVVLLAWTAVPGSAPIAGMQRWLRRLTLLGIGLAVLGACVGLWLLATRAGLRDAVVVALNGRLMIWTDVWNKTEAYRWIGAGFLGVEAVGPGGVRYHEVYDPHSAWLAQLVYFGVPGLVALAGLVAAMVAEGLARYRREVRVAPQQALLIAAIAGLVVQNVFEYFLTDPLLFSNAFALLLLGWWRTGLWEDRSAATAPVS